VRDLQQAGKAQDAANLEKVVIEAQGHRFRVSVSGLPQQGGGTRGKVDGFSAASRKRLLDLLAGLEPEQLDGFRYVGLFVTLTYAGPEADLPAPEVVKRDLDVFLKRVRRKFPDVSGVWRFEWDSKGERDYHPHLHLILFGVAYWDKSDLRRAWNEVSGNPVGSPSTDVSGLRSWRGVIHYAAKYVGKPTASLVSPSYLTGRVWGVFNREKLPQGETWSMTVKSGVGRWFYDLRRLARRVWDGVNDGRYQGFTLYVDDPGQWVRALLWSLSRS
jgi:hypothetical protein